jgi:hypothetical protein
MMPAKSVVLSNLTQPQLQEMGSTTLNEKQEVHQGWINSLLTQHDLAQMNEARADLRSSRDHMEECQLPERIRKVVADVNGTAGYHVLGLLDFLPPQKTVLRVSFPKQNEEHVLEIMLRERGATIVFYSRRKTHPIWGHFIQNHSRFGNSTTLLKLDFHPAEILDKNIESWFSYLLSGFKKKFKPSMKQPSPEGSEVRMGTVFGKVSA